MKKIVLDPSVEISLGTLDEEGARRVRGWFKYLENWDTDEAVRKNSVPLSEMPGVYVLRTTIDLLIFFQIEGDNITVIDIARRKAILATAGRNSGDN